MQKPTHETAVETSRLEAVLANFTSMVQRIGWRHRLSESDIDELLQDVRIRVWRAHTGTETSAPSRRENIEGVPASYIYRAATTAALDLIRRRRAGQSTSHERVEDAARAAHPVDDHMVVATGPEQEVMASELAEQVERSLTHMQESRRAVVRMYLAGYPREEIAQLLGWSEAKTRNLIYRGLRDLRARLTVLGVEADGRGERYR